MPYEFFSWRLMQTYYVQIKEGQNDVDPNYSSSAFGPGDTSRAPEPAPVAHEAAARGRTSRSTTSSSTT